MKRSVGASILLLAAVSVTSCLVVNTTPRPKLASTSVGAKHEAEHKQANGTSSSASTTLTPRTTTTEPVQAKAEKRRLVDQKAILPEGVECGKVPIFEKINKRSYNGSLGAANEDQEPNDEESGQFRILHGLDATYGEWPWIVRVSICEDPEDCSYCTGSLLNSRWLITAGHCAVDLENLSKYHATLGMYNLITPEVHSFSVPIDKLILHPDYNDMNNDISLMRLARDVEFNDFIQPVCLVGQTRNIVSRTARMKCFNIGYGFIEGMNSAISLQKIQIRAMKPSECSSDTLNDLYLRAGSVCVGPPRGKIGSSCKGDSGGPDVCYNPATNQWLLFGTVSFGPSDCDREADDKWLTVSADLSNYRSWILSSILSDGSTVK